MISFLPRLAAATALILLIPLIAMQITDEVNWDPADFALFGILLFGAGLTYELVTRMGGNAAYRIGAGLAIAGAFLLVWVNGAVGIIGSENNDVNMMYFGVLAVGFLGSIIARFEPKGMARALFATAFAQALVPVIALTVWQPPSWGGAGVGGVFILNTFFVVLFAGSALLLRQAALEQHDTVN